MPLVLIFFLNNYNARRRQPQKETHVCISSFDNGSFLGDGRQQGFNSITGAKQEGGSQNRPDIEGAIASICADVSSTVCTTQSQCHASTSPPYIAF